MMLLLNLIHSMKIHTRIVHLSCNYFETISHYGRAMHLMPMKQIHLKNISNCFVYLFPFSFLSVYNTHTYTYARIQPVTNQIDKTTKKNTFLFSFVFSLNTSINCASLYFYSFVDVNFILLSLSLCVCVGCNHFFFSLAVCSFSSSTVRLILLSIHVLSALYVLCRKRRKNMKKNKLYTYTHTINFFS